MNTVSCTAVIPVNELWVINYHKELLVEVDEVILRGFDPIQLRNTFNSAMEFISMNNFNKVLLLLHVYGRNVVLSLRNGMMMTYCTIKENWVIC